MDIALVAQQETGLSADESRGADDTRLLELSRSLAGKGHRLTVYTQRGAALPERAELWRGVTVEYIGPVTTPKADDAGLLAQVPAFSGPLHERLRRTRPDVIHAMRWTSGLAALAAARDLGIPVVQSFGPLGVTERRRHAAGHPGAGAERGRLEPAIGRAASAVLAGTTEELSDLARIGVPRRSVRIVPCGVDTEEFSPEGPVSGRAGRPRLLTVAGPAEHESLAALLHALPTVPEAELVIADGPAAAGRPAVAARRDLERLAASLGVAGRVTFTGRADRAGLPALLRSADLLLSVGDSDPDGLLAVRAMACGTPVIATTTGGGTADAVLDGTTGLLVPASRPTLLAKRIRQVLSHPMALEAFSVAAVDRARSRYSWDRIADEILAVYDTAANAAAMAA